MAYTGDDWVSRTYMRLLYWSSPDESTDRLDSCSIWPCVPCAPAERRFGSLQSTIFISIVLQEYASWIPDLTRQKKSPWLIDKVLRLSKIETLLLLHYYAGCNRYELIFWKEKARLYGSVIYYSLDFTVYARCCSFYVHLKSVMRTYHRRFTGINKWSCMPLVSLVARIDIPLC